jgi:hypothetical protein
MPKLQKAPAGIFLEIGDVGGRAAVISGSSQLLQEGRNRLERAPQKIGKE